MGGIEKGARPQELRERSLKNLLREQHINGGRADGTLERRFQTYLRPALLVLDDLGLKPLHPPAHEDLYDVINERYERGSIIMACHLGLAG